MSRPEPSESSDKREELVFRPDPRQVRRLAVLRRILGLAAAVIVGAAIAFVIAYRPAMDLGPGVTPSEALFGEPPEPVDPPGTWPGETAGPAPVEPVWSPADETRRLAVSIGERAAMVQQLWNRAQELVPRSVPDRDELPDGLASARLLADSAEALVDGLRRAGDSLDRHSRELPAARRYDVSGLQAALRDILSEYRARQRDLRSMLAGAQQALDAAAAGDDAGAEVKAGAVAGQQASAAARSRALARRLDALNTAVRRVLEWPPEQGGAGRPVSE